ncbi:MAG: integrin alpha, partial [Nitrososphaera sp.]
MHEKHYILITVLSLLLVTAHSLSSVHAADNEDPELTSQSAAVSTISSGVISGDFNNDGRDDLAIGVPNEDVGNTNIANAGAVNVIYGSASANGLS